MNLITSVPFLPAQLTSSTAEEATPATYSGATTYGLGAIVGVLGSLYKIAVYRSKQVGNLNHAPASSPTWWEYFCDVYQAYGAGTVYNPGDRAQDNTNHLVYERVGTGSSMGVGFDDTARWLKVGATNRYAAFDSSIGTVTTTLGPLVMVLVPGQSVNSLGVIGAVGTKMTVSAKESTGGVQVYYREIVLDNSVITDFFDWFYNDYIQLGDFTLTDLPYQFPNIEITIKIESSPGNFVGVGTALPGVTRYIGDAQKGASVGIIDFSVKTRDSFGNFTVLERAYSKRANYEIYMEKGLFNSVYNALAAARAKPGFYVGTDTEGFEPLLVYGYPRSFSIAIEYDLYYVVSMEVEGL